MNDDLHTYGAVPVTETYTGCGGEHCPDGTCTACLNHVKTTVTSYRARS